MAEIVRRRSWGGVLPLGRQASISGSSLIQCASVSIALSSFQEGQNARHHKQFKREQALACCDPLLDEAWRPPTSPWTDRKDPCVMMWAPVLTGAVANDVGIDCAAF